MKILFLHLSDSHIRSEEDLANIDSRAIIQAIKSIGSFDECVVVYSGDLTYSGSKEQFLLVKKFIGEIQDGIQAVFSFRSKVAHRKIYIECVPGNHDNYATDLLHRTHEELTDNIIGADNEKLGVYYDQDIRQLSNYYDFSDTLNGNTQSKDHHPIEVRYHRFGNFCLRVNLLNSAPFSLVSNDNGDKGWHYFPCSELSKLEPSNRENFTISIIHHDINWFLDDIKNKLRDAFRDGSNCVFFGHEHAVNNEEISSKGSTINTSCGYALYGTDSQHGFIANILDTQTKSVIQYEFIHDESANIYRNKGKTVLNDINLLAGKNFKLDPDFQKFLQEDSGQRKGAKFEDYFVFPSLEEEFGDDLKKSDINSEEGILNLIDQSTKIEIAGGRRSGKTILAKYLFEHLVGKYVPIYIDAEELSAKKIKADKVVHDTFIKIYGVNADFDAFLQLDSEKKILIVDNKELIDSQEWISFCENIQKNIGKIISFTNYLLKIDIQKQAIEVISEDETIKLRITPFYYKKRKELISKIYKIVGPQQPTETSIDETVKKINNDMMNQISRFEWNPEFIYQYVSYYVSQPLDQRVDSHILSHIYDINIRNSLIQNIDSSTDINEILTVLDCFAYNMFEAKINILNVTVFQTIIDKYNEEHDLRVEPKEVLDISVRANILSYGVGGRLDIMFCDQNLLSYFVAKHLNRVLNENNIKGEEDLNYLIHNISYAYYGNVLLFLSFIKEDLRIINPILQGMDDLMSDWKEYDIDSDDIKYLSNSFEYIEREQSIPNDEDRQKSIEQKDDIEKRFANNNDRNSLQKYNHDQEYINSAAGKISNAIAYLDLLSKILPSFRHILMKDDKKDIVEKIYRYPNKLIYFILHKFDENFDGYYKTIKEAVEKHPKTSRGMLITPDTVKHTLQTVSMAMILSIYDAVFDTAVDNRGIDDLNKYNYMANSNYRLENIMMEESRGTNVSTFSNKVMPLYNETKSPMLKQMISAVVKVYYLNHVVDMHGMGQKLADTFFGEKNRKKLSAIQARNSVISSKEK